MSENEKIAKNSKPGFGEKVSRWFREMKSELKKVVWPTRKQTLNNTWTVIVCVIVVGACIWIFDAVAALIIDALINLTQG